MSARSGPVTPRRTSGPPPVLTVSGPPISVARAGPPPESRFAPATPETATGPPWVATLTVTPGGTVTLKSTPQSELSHAGSDRLRRPPDTDCVDRGRRAVPLVIHDRLGDLDAADLPGRHLHLAAVALHDQAGDRLRHGLGPGHDVLRLGRRRSSESRER